MASKTGLLGLAPALLLCVIACGDSGDGNDEQDAGSADAGDLDAAPPPQQDGALPFDAAGGAMDGDAAPREAGSGDGSAPPAPGRDGAAGSDDLDAQLAPADANTEDALAPSDAQVTSDARVESDAASLDAAREDDASTADAFTELPESDAASSATDALVADSATDASAPAQCTSTQGPVVGALRLQTIISGQGLTGLTDAVQPPGSSDWYFVEQRGRVKVLRAGQTQLEAEPFLDLSEEIGLPNAGSYDDRGLVSIAFAPDYASSGRVYVSVTPDRGAYANLDLLLEYTRSSADPYRVDGATRRTVLEVRGSRLDSNGITVNIHNGGRVAFGPDGMLYLAMGDGGSVDCGAIEPDATQNVSPLFGKMLRLDLSRPEPHGADDNPFVGSGDPRVWHYGLRNPFRFSFDRLNGDLYLGDVGQVRFEEIDYAPSGAKGLNFGWAPYEANSRDTCPNRQLAAGSTHTPPVLAINRRTGAVGPFADFEAIIGGVVYRGTALPQLYGAYLFGGYRSLRLGAFYQCGDQTSPVTPILKDCDPNQPNAACLERLDGGAAFRELRAIVEDSEGEIYMVANGNSLLKVVAAAQ